MIISLPLHACIRRKTAGDKYIQLNLNVFRNLHYTVMNNLKKSWIEVVRGQIDGKAMNKPDGPFLFRYTVYPGTMRKFDVANVCAAVQKFTDDALIELGVIKDDNYKIVRAVDYRIGDVDPENPRIELEITRFEG